MAVALVALALSALALLDDGGRDDVLPAAGGGRLAPTQIGRVYQSAGPGVVSVQVGLGRRAPASSSAATARS